MNSARKEATIQQQIERRRFKMSWEEVLKGNNTDPKNHTFSFVVECDVDDIDSEVADFQYRTGQ